VSKTQKESNSRKSKDQKEEKTKKKIPKALDSNPKQVSIRRKRPCSFLPLESAYQASNDPKMKESPKEKKAKNKASKTKQSKTNK